MKGEEKEGRNGKQHRRITLMSAKLAMSLCRMQDNKWRHYVRKESKSMAKLQALCSEFRLSIWICQAAEGEGKTWQLQLLPPSSFLATTAQFTTSPPAFFWIPVHPRDSFLPLQYLSTSHLLALRKKRKLYTKVSRVIFLRNTDPQITGTKINVYFLSNITVL